MWFTLARFLWNFNVDVAPESRNWMDNQHAYLIWDKPPLLVHLTPRVPRVDPMGIEAKTQIQRGSLETGFNMFDQIKITKELHPNFGAEVSGVDFTRPVSEAVFEQILAAVTKVLLNFSLCFPMCHGVPALPPRRYPTSQNQTPNVLCSTV